MNRRLLPDWMTQPKSKRSVSLREETDNALRDIAFVLHLTKKVREEIEQDHEKEEPLAV